MERFAAHNTHWQAPENFEANDPQLKRLKKGSLVYESDLIHELPYIIPGIYTLSGGRQIGKTTLLKQWMRYLMERGIPRLNIFYMTGELIEDHTSLMLIIERYFAWLESLPARESNRILIIDEVTYVKNWDQGIKYLADSGAFENAVVMLTGSDTAFIKEARVRFPGRRGSASKVDFHLHPLSFFEFIRLRHKIKTVDPQTLLSEFEGRYLLHGGFLTAIDDYEKKQAIETATYNTYSDWVRGDFLKRGKRESYLREVLGAIVKTYGSQVTWEGLARHTSIGHHDTVRQYVELLESMDVLFVQHALREDKLTAAPKKAKKIVFKDPFMYRAMRKWVYPDLPDDDDIVPLLVESCVVGHYRRFYDSCYYIKAEGEVDLAYVRDNRFFPIEIKWRKQLRQEDVKQIAKYGNGLILNRVITPGTLNNVPTRFLPEHLLKTYLRERLEEITKDGLKEIRNSAQVKVIESLLGTKSVEYELPFKPLAGERRYAINGFAYELGLDNSKYYVDIAKEDADNETNRFFASPEFFLYLLKKGALKEIAVPVENGLVLYYDQDVPKSAGIVKSYPLIESKWGTFNRVFFHDVWSVPRSYGDTVKYYVRPNFEEMENHFKAYVESLNGTPKKD